MYWPLLVAFRSSSVLCLYITCTSLCYKRSSSMTCYDLATSCWERQCFWCSPHRVISYTSLCPLLSLAHHLAWCKGHWWKRQCSTFNQRLSSLNLLTIPLCFSTIARVIILLTFSNDSECSLNNSSLLNEMSPVTCSSKGQLLFSELLRYTSGLNLCFQCTR